MKYPNAGLQEELVGRARELAPLAARLAPLAEQQRAISAELITEFCDAGFMQALVPKRYGGHELDYRVLAGVVRAIAPSCSSAAWVLAFYMGHNYVHALFPEKSQDEVFGSRPYALTPGTAAPNFKLTPTSGGYLATGRSSWNSGSAAAEWFICGGLIKRGGEPPTTRVFLVPAADASIIDTWDVAAMKGTSSNDIVIDGAFVPEHRTVNALDFMDGRSPGAALHANPFYSLPVLPFILGEVVPVVVGAYCGAAAEFKRLTEVRQSAHTATKVSTKQTAQIRIARGLSGAALAEGMLDDYVRLLTTADPRDLRDPLVRASIKARCSLITEYCAEGINELMLGAGADAHRSSSPMQRYFRDINMLRVHGFLDLESACENYGRMLLGLTPIAPI